MSAKKRFGRNRVELHAEPWLIDLAAQMATRADVSLSRWIRDAILLKLEADGLTLPPRPLPEVKVEPPAPKRPRGRPRKKPDD